MALLRLNAQYSGPIYLTTPWRPNFSGLTPTGISAQTFHLLAAQLPVCINFPLTSTMTLFACTVGWLLM